MAIQEIIIGDSDLDSDWLKYIEGGKHKRADLAAHEAVAKRLAKTPVSKSQVIIGESGSEVPNYREATGSQRCDNCVFFTFPWCELYEFQAEADDVCDGWQVNPTIKADYGQLLQTAQALVLRHPGHPDQKVHNPHKGKKGKRGGGDGSGSGGINSPTVRNGVIGSAVTYENYAQLAKDVFNAQPEATKARIRETEKRIRAGTATIDIHRDANGNWDPERVKLHDKIIDDMVGKATPVENPEIILTGGLPGSGKSTVLKARGDKFDNHVLVDSDEIKAQLPEYEGWNAALTHEEASHVVGRVIERSVTERKNVVYDATLKSANTPRAIVNEFHEAGYTSKVIFVDIPMEESMNRAVNRFMGPTNRYVPLDYLATHDRRNIATLGKLKGVVDSWEHWDNNQPFGEPPTLIDKG